MKIHGLIGVDVKPPRNTLIRKNRYTKTPARWLIPALIALAGFGIIVAGIH
ncbi:MAG: hypothetical protein WA003_05735 [Desulfuromonadaceae bacterium]